jgi:hypothetical protein
VLVTLLHHLLKLLLLAVGHNRLQLLVRVLHQRAALFAPLLGAQRTIVPHRPHLLVLILQNGQHLLLLVCRQIQRLRQMLQLPFRAVTAVMRSRRALGIGLRSCRGGVLSGRLCQQSGWDAKRETENRRSRAQEMK